MKARIFLVFIVVISKRVVGVVKNNILQALYHHVSNTEALKTKHSQLSGGCSPLSTWNKELMIYNREGNPTSLPSIKKIGHSAKVIEKPGFLSQEKEEIAQGVNQILTQEVKNLSFTKISQTTYGCGLLCFDKNGKPQLVVSGNRDPYDWKEKEKRELRYCAEFAALELVRQNNWKPSVLFLRRYFFPDSNFSEEFQRKQREKLAQLDSLLPCYYCQKEVIPEIDSIVFLGETSNLEKAFMNTKFPLFRFSVSELGQRDSLVLVSKKEIPSLLRSVL